MPPETGSPEDWLRHARSDLALATAPRPAEVLLEALCFHAQQAAEKALKTILVWRSVEVPRSHSIGLLLDLVAAHVPLPPGIRSTAMLTDYAVAARYPAESEPIDEQTLRQL